MWEWEEAEAVCYLFALRQGAFLHLLLIIVFLLLLSGQAQRQSEGFWKDVRLPGVHWEQGEVDQLLLFVNSEEKNRKRPAWPSCSSCLSKSPSDKHVLVFSYFLLQDTEGGGHVLFYLRILVVRRVLGGRWSQRTLWLLTKYFVDCWSCALPVMLLDNLEERYVKSECPQ